MLSLPSYSAVNLTKATGGEALCVGADFITLSNMLISEGFSNDFSNAGNPGTLILNASSNFEFNTTVLPGVNVSGTGISQVGIAYLSSTSLEIRFNLFGATV